MPLELRQPLILLVMAFVLGGCASNQNLRTEPADTRPIHVEAGPASDKTDKTDKLWQVYERYAGVPYEYGGTSAEGFDCSGFITTAFREGLDQQLPRTTSQMLRHGKVVAPSEIQPGDLVFFRIGGKEQHAGIYMGGNHFMHASTSIGVTLSELNDYYWKDRLTQARRFD